MKQKHIGVFVGSMRRQSFTKSIANAVIAAAPEQLILSEIAIGDLLLFNQDYDDDDCPPDEWIEFRSAVKTLDGFLFITPEYNRSVPPLLKNAIDIASRPPGSNIWSGKPGGIIGVSPGKIGGFGASSHLRQILSCVNVSTMPQPEAYIGGVTALLDEEGRLIDEHTLRFIDQFLMAFVKWTDIFTPDTAN